jgi:hypothetical protein
MAALEVERYLQATGLCVGAECDEQASSYQPPLQQQAATSQRQLANMQAASSNSSGSGSKVVA